MNVEQETQLLPESIALEWIAAFEAALTTGDDVGTAALFSEQSYWRDVLAFDWKYSTFSGADKISGVLGRTRARTEPRRFRLDKDRTPPRFIKRAGRKSVEAFFAFDTFAGEAHAFVRLVPDEDGAWQAWVLLTTLHNIRGFEENIGGRRPTGAEYSQNFSGDNWMEQRQRSVAYEDRDPQVLIVGAGHSGLTLAARLKQMGVDALIVDQFDRVGDNWRSRYHSLTLHNEVWSNHLPYMPFPPTWPLFLPKDKIAGWLEAYAEFMELNVWNGTRFLGADYNADQRMWTASIRRADGSERTFRVPQLVLAIGSAAGAPYRPSLPGLENFQGEVLHSSEFSTATCYAGKRAIVIGTGVSGHDVAQEMYSNGVSEVTLVQRSSTTVLSLIPSGTMAYGLYKESPTEDADLMSLATPLPLLIEGMQRLTKYTSEIDKSLLDRLTAAGFEIDHGDDGAGFYLKYLTRGGGYYINVGCSDLIADGKIRLTQWRDVEAFVTDGMRLHDGTTIPADVVVLATGYANQQQAIGNLLGEDVADKVGPVWGLDDHGYVRNMWKRLNQDRLWLMGGSMIEGRLYSRYLAVLIRADLNGLLPALTGKADPATLGAAIVN